LFLHKRLQTDSIVVKEKESTACSASTQLEALLLKNNPPQLDEQNQLAG